MMYVAPVLSSEDSAVLELIGSLRSDLKLHLRTPRRWFGTLRKSAIARSIQGSNSIEGYNASLEEVAALVEGERPLNVAEETMKAIEGYRDALTYVLQLASTGQAIDVTLLKALHYMMIRHDPRKNPGQWRPGSIRVEDSHGVVVYEAPPQKQIESLVSELLKSLTSDDNHPLVIAAMAHLNLTLIHPFSDGNGRMARCLQTLVIASRGLDSPEFSSIEEYLGHNTVEYYAALEATAQGHWSPERSTKPWIRFCLLAYYRQAHTTMQRIRETETLWSECENIVKDKGVNPRVVGALMDAARGWKLRRPLYQKLTESSHGEKISGLVASRDLAALVEAELLVPIGQKRGRHYVPADALLDLWREIKSQRPTKQETNPYNLVSP